jgi:hypothetical protein
MYEDDVHFYMTYYIASKIGFGDINVPFVQGKVGTSRSAAFVIAWADHFTDVSLQTRPPLDLGQVLAHAVNPGGYEAVLRTYHFRLRGPAVLPGSAAAYAPLKMAIDEARVTNEKADPFLGNFDIPVRKVDWMLVGIGLHAYQDSWSHQFYESTDGHRNAPLGGHAPDYPWKDLGEAKRMAKATYDALASLYTKITHERPQATWEDIEEKIVGQLAKVGSAAAVKEARWADETSARVSRWRSFIESELKEPPPEMGSNEAFNYGQPADMIGKFIKSARRVTLPD